MDFSKFDEIAKGLKEDLQSVQDNKYEDVPKGTYEVKIEKMHLTESKSGDPMFQVWFKIVAGANKNQMIFMNQVLKQAFQIHIVNNFLKSLDTKTEIVFDSFTQYGDLIFEVFHKVQNDNLEFALEYGENKGFPTFKITDVFDEIPFN